MENTLTSTVESVATDKGMNICVSSCTIYVNGESDSLALYDLSGGKSRPYSFLSDFLTLHAICSQTGQGKLENGKQSRIS